ncbi:MAG: beta-N-acetylhexosaminidase [Actinomycetota bacterium]|nr:beta-N-acetylhexosaminidase [Actinomycetota bacterium]
MKPRGPMRRSSRAVLCAVVALISLAGCGGEPYGSSEGASEETREEGTMEEATERLSVRDAVGQMFVVGMGGTEPDYYIENMIRERNVGGVLLFGNNMESEEQTKELTDALQELSMNTEPAIPLFVAVDHEGGEVQSAPWVSAQPPAAKVGRRADPEEARRTSEEIGRELRRAGVNTNLAPVVDTGSGAAIGSRSYGEAPTLVARMGAAAIEGFERAGVVSAAKHFPNHGPALEDSHVARPVVNHDVETVLRSDLASFRAAVDAGVPMVMMGHLIYPAVDSERPASLSPAAVGVLRDELGFDGVIVTDDLIMEGARRGGTTAGAALRAVEAGVDLLIISGPPEEQAAAYDAIVAAMEFGEIPRERIHASVERIERVKDRYQIFGEAR